MVSYVKLLSQLPAYTYYITLPYLDVNVSQYYDIFSHYCLFYSHSFSLSHSLILIFIASTLTTLLSHFLQLQGNNSHVQPEIMVQSPFELDFFLFHKVVRLQQRKLNFLYCHIGACVSDCPTIMKYETLQFFLDYKK